MQLAVESSFGADAVYSQEEWTQQRKRVLGRLQEIEGALDDATHAAMTQVLYEYEVLLFVSQHVDGTLKWRDTRGHLSLFQGRDRSSGGALIRHCFANRRMIGV